MYRKVIATFAVLSIMLFATFTTAYADGGANTNTESELSESLQALRAALKDLGYEENSDVFQATIDPNADADAIGVKALRNELRELGFDTDSAIFQATIDPNAD